MQQVIDMARARNRKMSTGNFKKKMRTGQNCGTCPPGGGSMSIDQLAQSRGQNVVPGAIGDCRWMIVPMTGTLLAANTTLALTIANSPVGICVERIVVTVLGQPVTFQDLVFGNKPQWDMGEVYDQELFDPDGRCAACCLPIDCIRAGSIVTLQANRIPDAAADADIRITFALVGPTIGV